MNDTTPEVDARFREILRRRTPVARAQMGFGMFQFARECGRMGIRQAHPDLSDVEVEQRLFLRWYGDELAPAMIERGLARIAERFQNGNGPGSSPISTRPTAS
jgi:hypothetical protein